MARIVLLHHAVVHTKSCKLKILTLIDIKVRIYQQTTKKDSDLFFKTRSATISATKQ